MPTTRDRRRQERTNTAEPVQVRIVTARFETETANLSADGAYFIVNQPIAIEVVVKGVRRSGRLVRVESRTQAHDELGFAVRLDSPAATNSRSRA